MKQILIFLIFLTLSCICKSQTPTKTLSVTLTEQQAKQVIAYVDSLREVVYRSNATQPERTSLADRLKELENFIIAKFNEQNPPKKEEIKTEKKP